MHPGVDNVAAPGSGRIGLVPCPGVRAWPTDAGPTAMRADLALLREWGTTALVTLLQPSEMAMLGVESLADEPRAMGMAWWHLPITDGAAPWRDFESVWQRAGPDLHSRLDSAERIVVHCRAGLGRSGTVAARLLVERGMDPRSAISAVRRARHGAIENPEQEAWVLTLGD